ncbi:flagellar export chaperone FliS [Actimicrobium sp. CCC2.4]|uniref:flagellar export chaperone FliS n=1 Tax=Actimicrobium sp. CCC2.4 TaxID=3048606 RepID=UPI002AC9CA2E|nr:flagellar export chaperone FliS [Actimicrobium sp. CCC2.4]MEB0136411.1 flagellar export chaperone FliS [Actimicrobium sp. CCC2.4]WPX31230.1 flagellar export chaperone FliS [Actimicrobium sp. CCC2.4]
MFGKSSKGANAYATVSMETGVTSASPHKLIVMLFDGALVAVAIAEQQMKDGNIQAKGKSISKAISIIDNGLRASLDKKVGGQIAESLDALYAYMSNRLLVANLKNQPEILQEVHTLLMDLKSAWDAIGQQAEALPAATAAPVKAAPDMSTYAPTMMKA